MFDWLWRPVNDRLDVIDFKLSLILRKENIGMAQQDDIKAALDKLRQDVTAQTSVVAGMAVYVAGIQMEWKEKRGALMALASQIESNTKSDADAMAANIGGTAPVPTSEPVVEPAPPTA